MDRFMFKLIVPNPGLEELMQIVDMTQKTMDEVAEAACTGDQLLKMRATANQIPVAEEVMRYAMKLCSATHPDSEYASAAAKKYIRLGASPRAGQALISAAKVKALMLGRFNVSYGDIDSLAFPVLRHRIKLNFEAIAARVTADEIIRMIVEELSGKRDGARGAKAADVNVPAQESAPAENAAEAAPAASAAEPTEEAASKKRKRGFLGRK